MVLLVCIALPFGVPSVLDASWTFANLYIAVCWSRVNDAALSMNAVDFL